jgi:hypothetical protein
MAVYVSSPCAVSHFSACRSVLQHDLAGYHRSHVHPVTNLPPERPRSNWDRNEVHSGRMDWRKFQAGLALRPFPERISFYFLCFFSGGSARKTKHTAVWCFPCCLKKLSIQVVCYDTCDSRSYLIMVVA